ncbi:putative kinetochore protein Ndc80 [Helianthus annuus]|nr:putative kinetochore protein Ndc80 [Helianthus annuus]KAJ0607468.1 putative kinetochore protein Ndc80 [Helianthus annuus]KAJ0767531.1 putative kinetochore protein Ndc80 [Helianthus annuus]
MIMNHSPLFPCYHNLFPPFQNFESGKPNQTMRGPAGRRPQATTPTPADPWQFSAVSRRDSDASFCSSRPSSTGANHHRNSAVAITDRSYQLHAVSTINSFLSTTNCQVSLKLKPLPSNSNIIETLKHVLKCLDYPVGQKLEDDLSAVLKCLNCPIKMNKSALKAPGTPHSFPNVLAVIHWLVQIAMFNDNLGNSHSFSGDGMFVYNKDCYLSYIQGDDDAVEKLDEDFLGKLQQEKNLLLEDANVLSENAKDLELKLEAMKSGPSLKEAKEKEKNTCEKDIEKFNALIQQLKVHEGNAEKQIEEKEKVEDQGINMRDAERMRRELQSVVKDIGDAEDERIKWEEKCWDLNNVIGTKFKELEALQTQCNQAIRRLKLGSDIQYELNANGKTAAEVLGMDYKSRLDPVLSSSRDEVKRSSMENLETLMSLQQLSRDIAAKIDAKRNRIAILQSRIDEVENQLITIKNETQDYTSRCLMEASQLINNFEVESRKVEYVEKEAREFVESSKAKLQETMTQCEEEVQMCAHELFALIDSVSKYKEFTVCKLSEINNAVSETAAAIAQVHKDALTSYLGI